MAGRAASTPGAVTLSWEAPTLNTNGTPLADLAGYTISYGTNPSLLTESVKINGPTATAYTFSNLTAGVWYFAVSGYTGAGTQGARSKVARATVKAARR